MNTSYQKCDCRMCVLNKYKHNMFKVTVLLLKSLNTIHQQQNKINVVVDFYMNHSNTCTDIEHKSFYLLGSHLIKIGQAPSKCSVFTEQRIRHKILQNPFFQHWTVGRFQSFPQLKPIDYHSNYDYKLHSGSERQSLLDYIFIKMRLNFHYGNIGSFIKERWLSKFCKVKWSLKQDEVYDENATKITTVISFICKNDSLADISRKNKFELNLEINFLQD